MTNYHLKPPEDPQSVQEWQLRKEQRRKVLAGVRKRRAEQYRRLVAKMHLVNKQAW